MRALALTVLIACRAPAQSAPFSRTPQILQTLSATFSIQDADRKEHDELVTDGSVLVMCGVSLHVVRIDTTPNAPGAVFVHQPSG